MKQVRLMIVGVVLTLGLAVPLVSAMTQAPAHSTDTRVALRTGAAPTWSPNGPTPCTSGGC